MIKIPDNYFDNLSSYEEFAIKTNLLGYDVDDPKFLKVLFDEYGSIVINGRLALYDADNEDLALYNAGLTSLEGCPATVPDYFDCSKNMLTSLKGGPSYVGGDFYCDHNNLTSLEGGPQTVGKRYYCEYNKLKTLKGAPHTVHNFACSDNELTTLEGSPLIVTGYFDCTYNPLVSLKGAPQRIEGDFMC